MSALSYFITKKILNVVLLWVLGLRHLHNVKLRDKTRHYSDNASEGHYKPAWVLERIRAPSRPYIGTAQATQKPYIHYTTKGMVHSLIQNPYIQGKK